jgi:hypothetical protein
VWPRRREEEYDLRADIHLIMIRIMELSEKLDRLLARFEDDDEEE